MHLRAVALWCELLRCATGILFREEEALFQAAYARALELSAAEQAEQRGLVRAGGGGAPFRNKRGSSSYICPSVVLAPVRLLVCLRLATAVFFGRPGIAFETSLPLKAWTCRSTPFSLPSFLFFAFVLASFLFLLPFFLKGVDL